MYGCTNSIRGLSRCHTRSVAGAEFILLSPALRAEVPHACASRRILRADRGDVGELCDDAVGDIGVQRHDVHRAGPTRPSSP